MRKSAGNIYANDINRTTGFAVIENGRWSLPGEQGDQGAVAERGAGGVEEGEVAQGGSGRDVRLSEPIMAKSQAK